MSNNQLQQVKIIKNKVKDEYYLLSDKEHNLVEREERYYVHKAKFVEDHKEIYDELQGFNYYKIKSYNS